MRELVLEDALEVLIDHRGKTPKKLGADFVDEGVPVASAILVDNGILNLDDARRVSEDVYRRWMPVPTRKGDVLLTSEAPLGRVARVPSNDPLALGQRIFGLRGKEGVLDSGYLYYALQTRRLQDALVGRSTGTTVIGIRQSALRTLRVPAPSYEEQRAIADVLGALDDKIAANVTLVDRAERLIVSLAAQSSSAIQVSRLAKRSRETAKPQSLTDPLVRHFSLPAFDAGRVAEAVEPASIKSSKFRLSAPAVLVSKLNPRFPRVWDVPVLPNSPALASTEFVVLEPLNVSTTVLWALLSQPAVSRALQSMVAGTSGSHQRVRPEAILAADVGDPSTLPAAAVEQISSLGRRVEAARSESSILAAIRDALLPGLMSEKLRVRDAVRLAEGVV